MGSRCLCAHIPCALVERARCPPALEYSDALKLEGPSGTIVFPDAVGHRCAGAHEESTCGGGFLVAGVEAEL